MIPIVRFLFLRSRLLILGAAALMTLACGQTSPLSSPTAPTGSMSGSLSADGGADPTVLASAAATFSTLDKGGSHNDKPVIGAGDDQGEDNDADENGRGNGELSGFVTAIGTNALTVRGMNVIVNDGTRIRHGQRTLTILDIHVGDHVQVRGHLDGNNLVATEIKVEDTGNDNENDHVEELKGTVAGISSGSGCPVLTFTLNTNPSTTVKTNASTVFEDVTCAAFANGAIVEIEGIRQPDGSVLAKNVEAEAGPDEVEGKISDLSGTGSCPALTFKVGTTTVTTSASTAFSGVTCAALANGAQVEVEGTKQANGTIAAAEVKLD